MEINISESTNDFIKEKIIEYYNKLEDRIVISERNGSRYNTPVNFKKALNKPRHRWYTYKEGFSPDFVHEFIQNYSTQKEPVVFDPFGGIGTTVLEANALGLEAYSNDVNPLSNFISKVKATRYLKRDIALIKKATAELNNSKLSKKALPPNNETVLKYFSEDVLEAILKVQHWIEHQIPKTEVQNIFRLALISLLEKVSTHRKDGNGVKRKKNYTGDIELKDLISLLNKKVDLILEDIEASTLQSSSMIYSRSSFDPYKLPKKADLVITSPPYANCFDYSKVYLVELWFGSFFKEKLDQKSFRDSSITSHVHYTWEKRHDEYGLNIVNSEIFDYLASMKLWNKRIPHMLSGYFSDMGKVLFELKDNLNPGAHIGIVVGNSVYGGLPIATDILLAQIAENLGYEIKEIDVYRYLNPSSQQLRIMKEDDKRFLRESLIVLKWK